MCVCVCVCSGVCVCVCVCAVCVCVCCVYNRCVRNVLTQTYSSLVAITTVVLPQHWCHHNTGVTRCHLLNVRISGLSVHTLTTLSDPPVARHVPSGLKHRALTSLSWASCWIPHIAATLVRCALLRITYKLVDNCGRPDCRGGSSF